MALFSRTVSASLILVAGLIAAADRKTVFLDRMGGLETYIEKAAEQQELNVEFIEEAMHPDLKVLLGNKFTSVSAEILYKKNTGRAEDTTLQVIDMKTRKPLVTHDFRMATDDAGKRRIATDLVKKLKGKLQ